MIFFRKPVPSFREHALAECLDHFLDVLQRALRCLRADLYGLLGAMKVEHTDRTKTRADHDIGGIAGQARARNAILHDVIGLDHDGRQPGPALRAEELALEKLFETDALAPMTLSAL